MQHVVSIGGGLTSTVFLPERVIAQHGAANVTLVMARLPNEDPDVWRLCDAVEARLGVPITYIGRGLTPWDVFYQQGMMGSSRVDLCSRMLKREVLLAYMQAHHDPATTVLHVGITANEIERMIAVRANWGRNGWTVDAPLSDGAFLTRAEQMAACEARFGFVPRLYRYGFDHNNCGGACVKAGHRSWARLLWYLPDVYAWWETNEARFQVEHATDATILRNWHKDRDPKLSLRAFRLRCERWWAGCLPGMDFDLLPRVKELDPTPACAFCEAA
jgi:hypothetical protein